MSRAHLATPEALCIAAEEAAPATPDDVDLARLLARIPEREATALRLRDGFPRGHRRTLHSVASAMGLRGPEEAAALVAQARRSVLTALEQEDNVGNERKPWP